MVVLALPFDTRGLKVAEVAKESLFLVCNKSDIASQAKSLDDLDLSRLMLLEEGHCFRSQIMNLCELQKASKQFHSFEYEAGSIETLRRMVDINVLFF